MVDEIWSGSVRVFIIFVLLIEEAGELLGAKAELCLG